jgi:hypothetical protein
VSLIETPEERLVEQVLLDNSVFFSLLQEKGKPLRRSSKRQRIDHPENSIVHQGCSYTNIWKLANLLENFILVACDTLISLLPNRPDNSATRVTAVGILVLDSQDEPGGECTEYTLDKQELLRLVLRVWDRSKTLAFLCA